MLAYIEDTDYVIVCILIAVWQMYILSSVEPTCGSGPPPPTAYSHYVRYPNLHSCCIYTAPSLFSLPLSVWGKDIQCFLTSIKQISACPNTIIHCPTILLCEISQLTDYQWFQNMFDFWHTSRIVKRFFSLHITYDS